jgi:hypothetical protein
MSKTFHHGERRHGQRQIRVHGVRHQSPDLRKLARALISFAQAQAEAEAQVEIRRPQKRSSSIPTKPRKDPAASDSPREDSQGDAA